jgi:hypothetical protein
VTTVSSSSSSSSSRLDSAAGASAHDDFSATRAIICRRRRATARRSSNSSSWRGRITSCRRGHPRLPDNQTLPAATAAAAAALHRRQRTKTDDVLTSAMVARRSIEPLALAVCTHANGSFSLSAPHGCVTMAVAFYVIPRSLRISLILI